MSERVVIIPDAHHPYVDKAAWELMLTAIDVLDPDYGVIIGDFGDFSAVSSHPRRPDERLLIRETDAVNIALDQVQAAGPMPWRYMEGNHEDRLRLFKWSKAPELAGFAEVETILGFAERDMPYHRYHTFSNIGKVFFNHGWRTGVNAARQTVLDSGRNIVVGHSHRGALATSGEIAGNHHFCLNVGWLGDLNAALDWASPGAYKDWQLGFGIVDIDGDYASPIFVPIIETSKFRRLMILEGETYKA